MQKIKQKKGITLIALVVTIIVLLVIVGVTIGQITGSGIFEKITEAREESKYAAAEEKVKMAVMASYGESGEIEDSALKDNLENIDGFEELEGFSGEGVASYPVKVTVDGYIFSITDTGILTAEGRTQKENKKLPKNTEDTEAGTEVALEEGWGTEAVAYYKTADGTVEKPLATVSTVYAVSVGGGETIPVPYGFYYVGGNIESGAIISDNPNDKNKGLDWTTTGDADGSKAHAGAETLEGNQFIWIPCSASNYKKVENYKVNNGGDAWNAEWDRQTNRQEVAQIQKYGGFYIGRYEAGTTGITFSSGSIAGKITTTTNSYGWGWQNTNFTASKASGRMESKANEIPWYHADYPTAIKATAGMYDNKTFTTAKGETDNYKNYIESGLVTGTQWDMMLQYINTDMKSTSWGNYINNSLENLRGKHAAVDGNGNLTEAWTDSSSSYKTTANERALLTTGSTNTVQKKHIYDVAGNLWEWTDEASYLNGGSTTYYGKNSDWNTYMLRGGGFYDDYSVNPACFRSCSYSAGAGTANGFRAALYLK